MKNKISGIILILLILAVGSAFAQELTSKGDGRFVTEEIEQTVEITAPGPVEIYSAESLSGEIQITARAVEKATFSFRKMIRADDENIAIEYSDKVSIIVEQQAGKLKIILQAPNPSPWDRSDDAMMIEGKLIIPNESMINIKSKYFDFNIDGPLKSVVNEPSFGKFQINDVSNMLNITTTGSDISLKNISGKIDVSCDNGDIHAYDIEPEKTARFKNKSGDISISRISGGLDIINNYGKIKIDDAIFDKCQVQISGEFSPVNLEIKSLSNSEITIDNENEDIDVGLPATGSAQISLSVDVDSEIHVEGVPVRPIKIRPKYLELLVGDGNSVINADINGVGDIFIEGGK